MKKVGLFFLSIVMFAIGSVAGFIGVFVYTMPESDVYVSGDLSFHFLELGNGKTGDCIYIKSGSIDILVDAGSRTNSADTIETYVKSQMTDDVLDYVIVTHADQDHIACFAGDNTNSSLFTRFDVDVIIDFPLTNKKLTTDSGNATLYATYLESRDAEISAGAKHYNALECYNNENGANRSYDIGNGATLNILYNYFYDHKASDENNYSVCFQIEAGEDKFLFTGDLESKGEEYLVEYNSLSKVKLFKAGHHGSPTSSNDCLLDIIQPEICVVCCCAGSVEYTDNLENTFPSQAFVNRISNWTDSVYVPTIGYIAENGTKTDGSIDYIDTGYDSLNGNVKVIYLRGTIKVECSNNDAKLKDTEWFKTYRTCPTKWEASA